ncbi:uncharacterized protein LOC129598895 [Paramacrobiotus metropolitanus]|uniref:uncharacterized protein LOC129598895 n=1 Tax=Paramacrobiotus metropolitanus TaxID=2943436 RepID=UPI002446261B|nr:uncharacterized protein LOC129598895 [Paramacrobiotus metropolitanus]
MPWLNLKRFGLVKSSKASSNTTPKATLYSNRKRSVTFAYQIPTAQFVGKRFRYLDGDGRYYWIFSANLTVEKQWDYPEIPQSEWTVSLDVNQDTVTGHPHLLFDDKYAPRAKVVPKKGFGGLTGSGEILVEGKVRASDTDPSACTTVVIGPSGWTRSRKFGVELKLGHLMCCKTAVDKHGHPRKIPALIEGYVYVWLTFHIQQHERHDLQRLLDSGLMTDCTLVSTDGRKFPVHRAILAVQSPVLSELLQSHELDKTAGQLAVVDADGKLLKTLIGFAYTRELQHTADGRLEDLWMLAKKFGMQELCAACECRLISGVDKGNAMRYYIFSREFGLAKLQQSAGTYIGKDPMGV